MRKSCRRTLALLFFQQRRPGLRASACRLSVRILVDQVRDVFSYAVDCAPQLFVLDNAGVFWSDWLRLVVRILASAVRRSRLCSGGVARRAGGVSVWIMLLCVLNDVFLVLLRRCVWFECG